MSRQIIVLLLAVFALAACETSANVDQDELDRQERQLYRQLGGD